MYFIDLWSANDHSDFDQLFKDIDVSDEIREMAVIKKYFLLIEHGNHYQVCFDITDVFPFILDVTKFVDFRYMGKYHELIITTKEYYDYEPLIPEHLLYIIDK